LRRRALDFVEIYPHLSKTTVGLRMPTFENKVWKKWRPGSYSYYKGEIINVNFDKSQNEESEGNLWYKVRFDPNEDHLDYYVKEYLLDPDMRSERYEAEGKKDGVCPDLLFSNVSEMLGKHNTHEYTSPSSSPFLFL
jgi:hypothetical protein